MNFSPHEGFDIENPEGFSVLFAVQTNGTAGDCVGQPSQYRKVDVKPLGLANARGVSDHFLSLYGKKDVRK